MKLFEFGIEDSEILKGYYDPAEDKIDGRKLTDTRKKTLTLRHLNRLSKMRSLKKLEDLKRHDLLGMIYAPPEADAGGGGLGGSPF